MQLLLPAVDATAAHVSVDEAYKGPLGTPRGRPWIGLCMVSSLDGSTVVDGRSGGLSSTNDSDILQRLRQFADVVLVGAGTVRSEGYGPPRTPGQRIGVVTASGSVDTTTALFSSGAGFVVTTERAEIAGDVDVLRAGGDTVDLRGAVERLHEVHPDPTFVQAEGGARLNGSLLDADLLDEINLTLSPLTVGGAGPRLTGDAASDHDHRYELAQLVVDEESFVFSRWLRRPATSP